MRGSAEQMGIISFVRFEAHALSSSCGCSLDVDRELEYS